MMIAIRHGDALDSLRAIPPDSIDAVVTDPPAGIGFMGKEWDTPGALVERKADTSVAWDRVAGNHHPENDTDRQRTRVVERRRFVAFLTPVLAECLRVAKPGARMFCWAIPRTCGWTQTAIEDAGWLVENCAVHLFGSGFPKGRGQLKPAAEFWFLARKPGGKVPALNVDACRVAGAGWRKSDGAAGAGFKDGKFLGAAGIGEPTQAFGEWASTAGRWPPNVLLSHLDGCKRVGERRVANRSTEATAERADVAAYRFTRGSTTYTDADGLETVAAWKCVDGCPVRALDEQSGERVSNGGKGPHTITAHAGEQGYGGNVRDWEGSVYGDVGGASRFFPQFESDEALSLYAAKASRAERNAGCGGLPFEWTPGDEPKTNRSGQTRPIPGTRNSTSGNTTPNRGNIHPTVKPQALMRWLCRLITSPGGTVVDPFMGSGSTGVACVTEGLSFIGIEREAEYVEIARARIAAARREPEQLTLGGAA